MERNRSKWWAVVKTAVNLPVPSNAVVVNLYKIILHHIFSWLVIKVSL
jgi:hypothetical protein